MLTKSIMVSAEHKDHQRQGSPHSPEDESSWRNQQQQQPRRQHQQNQQQHKRRDSTQQQAEEQPEPHPEPVRNQSALLHVICALRPTMAHDRITDCPPPAHQVFRRSVQRHQIICHRSCWLQMLMETWSQCATRDDDQRTCNISLLIILVDSDDFLWSP